MGASDPNAAVGMGNTPAVTLSEDELSQIAVEEVKAKKENFLRLKELIGKMTDAFGSLFSKELSNSNDGAPAVSRTVSVLQGNNAVSVTVSPFNALSNSNGGGAQSDLYRHRFL